MERPGARTVPLFEDGFGVRVLAWDAESGGPVEQLTFSPELAEVDEFAPALADLLSRHAASRHASFLRARRLDRPAPGSLVLVSEHVAGWRLSDLLRLSAREGVPIDLTAALNLLRQLVPAVALVSQHQKDLAIGNIAPQRLIVTPQGRLVIAEHLLGSAIESLHYSRERYWNDLRVALPPAPRISPRADATGIGIAALSLLLGRTLEADEFPGTVAALLDSAREQIGGLSRPLGVGLQSWLSRALQLDVRTAFQSPREMLVAFEAVLASDRAYVTASDALESWLQHAASTLGPPADLTAMSAPEPPPAAQAIEVADRIEAPVASPSQAHASIASIAPSHADGESESARDEATEAEKPAEEAWAPATFADVQETRPGRSRLTLALAAVALVEAAIIVWLAARPPRPPLADEGELVVQTRPASARVSVDGEERGISPLTLRLSPGTHVLEVRVGRAEPRVIPLTILAGVQTAQYVELLSVPTTGGLEVTSDPPRARVAIDGAARGVTPLVLTELPPGEHEVAVDAGRGRIVQQRVRVEPGVTAQLVVPLPR